METVRAITMVVLGIIALGIVFSHGDVAVNLVNSGAKFVTNETTALQMR